MVGCARGIRRRRQEDGQEIDIQQRASEACCCKRTYRVYNAVAVRVGVLNQQDGVKGSLVVEAAGGYLQPPPLPGRQRREVH